MKKTIFLLMMAALTLQAAAQSEKYIAAMKKILQN
jgi:hypothetical protein